MAEPPACRSECRNNGECALHLACRNGKCRDPCPGACGARALCRTVMHSPICTCPVNYVGDPFVRCLPGESHISTYKKRHLLFELYYSNCVFQNPQLSIQSRPSNLLVMTVDRTPNASMETAAAELDTSGRLRSVVMSASVPATASGDSLV